MQTSICRLETRISIMRKIAGGVYRSTPSTVKQWRSQESNEMDAFYASKGIIVAKPLCVFEIYVVLLISTFVVTVAASTLARRCSAVIVLRKRSPTQVVGQLAI